MGFLSGKKEKKTGSGKTGQAAQARPAKAEEKDLKLSDENAKNLARMLQIYMKENDRK